MSVRMRHTSSHSKNRRSHHALQAASIVKDKESGALRLPHRLDETTGTYRGKLIVPGRKEALAAEGARRARNKSQAADAEAMLGAQEPVVEASEVDEKQPEGTELEKGEAEAAQRTERGS